MVSDEQIKTDILYKLHRKRKWGHSHTSFENIKKGFQRKELGKEGTKRVERIAKELIKERLLLSKPTHYGLQVSLNPRERETIIFIIRKYFSRPL